MIETQDLVTRMIVNVISTAPFLITDFQVDPK